MNPLRDDRRRHYLLSLVKGQGQPLYAPGALHGCLQTVPVSSLSLLPREGEVSSENPLHLQLPHSEASDSPRAPEPASSTVAPKEEVLAATGDVVVAECRSEKMTTELVNPAAQQGVPAVPHLQQGLLQSHC